MAGTQVVPSPFANDRLDTSGPGALVSHCHWVEAQADAGVARAMFERHGVDYIAVVEQGRVVGLCSRAKVCAHGRGKSARNGGAGWTVRDGMSREILCVRMETPLREVLDRAVARTGEGFFEDIVLVDANGGLVGLVSMKVLVRMQGRLLSRQFESLAEQRDEVARTNEDLVCTVRALQMARARYAALFEGTALPVGVFSAEGFLEEGNTLLRTLLGVEPGRARSGFSIVSCVAAAERAELVAMLGALRLDSGCGTPAGREFHFNLPGRGVRLLDVHVRAIPASDWICVCFEDVTERRALERVLAQQEKHELLETLVGGIAHELNNKLLPVMGFAELLRKDLQKEGAPKEDLSYCEHIEESAQAAAKIVKSLLQSSRPVLEAPVPFDLRGPVQQAMDLVHFRLGKVEAEYDVALPEEPVTVLGDPVEIHQLLVNLLLNACDAMENAERRRLGVSVENGGSDVVVRVSDSGSGIAPETLHRIFDPFFTTKGPGRGTGLGLAICYSIVERHNGRIFVEDTGPEGTVFRITFPAHHRGAAGAAAVAREGAMAAASLAG